MLNKEEENQGLLLAKIKQINDADASYEWKVYKAALMYIDLGWYLVPVQVNGKAIPPKRYNFNYGHASRNKKVIESWFNPDDGTFAGWNIGLATGRTGGIFVIDVDRHGETDGVAVMDRLLDEHGQFPDCPTQLTPNGGYHYIMQWEENLRCTTNSIGPSIDTRGGTDVACQGHILAWPSIVDGKMYEWQVGGPVPVTPKWVNKALGVPWNPRVGSNRGNQNITDEDIERPIEKFQIINMLRAIDPDNLSYDEWLRVGLSIKSQLPDEDGLEIWDEWSKKGKRYDHGECNVRWNGFSDFGTVRGGTLFHHAKEAGWKPDREKGERSGNPIDEIVASLNEVYAIVTIGGKLRILREKPVRRPAEVHYDLMDKESFTMLLGNKFMWSGGEKPQKVPISSVWLSHEARRTYEYGMALFPNEEVPEGWYNTWNGYSIEPKEGNCELFLQHIEKIVCSGNDKWYEWLLDWLADLVQNPAEPKGCAIVMRGGEGVGKGTLANTIGEIFGPHYRHLIDDAHLLSNFNSHLFDAVFVFADEITWGGNKKTAGKLKGMVTERDLVGERKGVDAISYRNLVHLMIASNSEWVIPAGADSRRWFVLDVPTDVAGKHKYFNKIHKELTEGGKEALLYFLLNRKIRSNGDHLRRAPVTQALREQRLLTAEDDTILAWLVHIITRGSVQTPDIDNPNMSWPMEVLKSDLHDEYIRYCLDRRLRQTGVSVFSKELRKYKVYSVRKRIENERKYVFTVPKMEELKTTIETKFPAIFGDDDET